jgi:hypothetical protein
VQGFKARRTIWDDYGIQARAAVVYGGLEETAEAVDQAREVICKVTLDVESPALPRGFVAAEEAHG